MILDLFSIIDLSYENWEFFIRNNIDISIHIMR